MGQNMYFGEFKHVKTGTVDQQNPSAAKGSNVKQSG